MKLSRMAALILLVLPTLALAQADGDNGIGIYFDQGATQTVTTVSPVTQESGVQAWVVATNLPAGQLVVRWAGSVIVTNGAADAFPVCGHYVWGYHTFGHEYAMNMCCSYMYWWDVWGGPQDAIPVGATTVLGRVDIALQGCLEPLYLYLGPTVVDLLGVPGDIALNPSSGSWNRPLAVINGPAPVLSQPETWGRLKSLYR